MYIQYENKLYPLSQVVPLHLNPDEPVIALRLVNQAYGLLRYPNQECAAAAFDRVTFGICNGAKLVDISPEAVKRGMGH